MPIITRFNADPAIDGRQSEIAMDIQRGILTSMVELGLSFLPEFTLPSGRRVDLIALDEKGMISIIEIKSSITDFNADHKWHEYKRFCDRFYFASHPSVPQAIFPESEGFILSDRHESAIIREAELNKLAGATRRSLTLKIARVCAMRLQKMIDFHGPDTPPSL